jgi:amino acid transporter
MRQEQIEGDTSTCLGKPIGSTVSCFALGTDAIGLDWLASIIKLGAILGLSSVILVLLLGQPRILYSMADRAKRARGFPPLARASLSSATHPKTSAWTRNRRMSPFLL